MSEPDNQITKINAVIQTQLKANKLSECSAIEASEWLEKAGLLRRDRSKPGRPLRVLLRKGLIKGARKGPAGRWVIRRLRI